MVRKIKSMLVFVYIFALVCILPVFAVDVIKVSEFGDGIQIWFEAEAFDERSPNENYKLGIEEGALKPNDGAFGDIITNAGGNGWLLYNFDISRAGGEAGMWRFIGRIINPSNASDWLWVLGDDGDEIPDAAPAFVRPDHIIFENNTPDWAWVTDGDFGADGGTVMMIWTRGSNLTDQYDVFLWTDDLLYKPTDEDYIEAEEKKGLSVNPTGNLATTWGGIKQD